MRATVMAAAFTLLLATSWMVFVHKDDETPTPGETLAPASELPTQPEPRAIARTSEPVAAFPSFNLSTNEPSHTNLYARFAKGGIPKVSREQLEPFLTKNHRSVEALLGALRASGDNEVLREVKETYPNDPRVQFAAAFKSESPEERQQWLEKFKKSAPDNALANYLLASEQFKSGHAEQALQELAAATAKPGFQSYLMDFVQNAEEAYHACGYSEAEAKVISMNSALLPELGPLKQLSIDIVDLVKRYQQAGDDASASALQTMALNLGQRLNQSPQVTLIHELVGGAIERMVLGSMNPNAPYGDAGRTVQNQMDVLAGGRKERRALFAQAEPGLMTLSDQDLTHFYDRVKIYGEVAAMRWVVNQTPP